MMLPNRCSFSAHQRTHKNRPPHVCPECGGNFLQANFQTHLREACLHFSRRVGYRCLRRPPLHRATGLFLSSRLSMASPGEPSPPPPSALLCWRTCHPLHLVTCRESSGEQGSWGTPALPPQATPGDSGPPPPPPLPCLCSLVISFDIYPVFKSEWGAAGAPTSPRYLPFLSKVPQLCSGVWGCELHQVPHTGITLRSFPQVPHLPHGLQVCAQRPCPPLLPASQLPHPASQVRPGREQEEEGWAGGQGAGWGSAVPPWWLTPTLCLHRLIYKCAMCDTVFTHKPLLSSHFDQHLLPQRVSVFKCPSCPLLFAQKRTMLEHLKVQSSKGLGTGHLASRVA